ncbi:hypothetical protein CMUS01_01838 [Colletotrichum musicola]|uniref:ToxB-like N-terminal ascomycota domain-containing protein n=2 Tax=Colletotrichum orchidearum species complex TaxID=2707337 RepID=A0A8H6U844_9PEZI|nr:hypothetical protein CPLU01_11149 [Colletotrichum plurivorum]KAF6843731.1 hypothetical protein CMUS01_01838 [Colletotrichum musicola]
MKFTAAICLLASYAGLASAAVGCQVEILNVSQASVGSGCVPFDSFANILNTANNAKYAISATRDCGFKVQNGQRLPDGFSLRKAGFC